MRTTLRIDDELLKEAKRIALESDRTLTQVVEDSLRETFAQRKSQQGRKRKKVALPTSGHGGLRPGLTWDDLNSYGRMLDIMDALEASQPDDADSGR
jgi:hypothetical protein